MARIRAIIPAREEVRELRETVVHQAFEIGALRKVNNAKAREISRLRADNAVLRDRLADLGREA